MTPTARTDSFFPPVRPSADPAELDEPLPGPGWSGPPWHYRPGIAGFSQLIGFSESTAVLFEGARSYPGGAVLRLAVRVRETAREARRQLFAQLEFVHGRGMLHMGLQPGGLRWGLAFADGSRVTSLDDSPWDEAPPGDSMSWLPDRPVLLGVGRPEQGFDTWSRDLWLCPLPPGGPIRAVCLWPDRGIEETSSTFDAAVLLSAAELATPMWPAVNP
ncbi:MAG: hypothetical protein ABJD68_07925 [Nakamurella sp.]